MLTKGLVDYVCNWFVRTISSIEVNPKSSFYRTKYGYYIFFFKYLPIPSTNLFNDQFSVLVFVLFNMQYQPLADQTVSTCVLVNSIYYEYLILCTMPY